jgi:NADPH:quinone reductase-like Zn-dependent oxidoreductase
MKAIVQDKHGSPEVKNHRLVVSGHGGPEVLPVVEEGLPDPRAGEVRVKVLAAGVSAYDLMHRRSGSLPGTPRVRNLPEDWL